MRARAVALTLQMALAVMVAAHLPAYAGCRAALAIGMDVSGSVDPDEMALQAEGMARALTAPDVMRAFLGPRGGGVRLAIYDWSGVGSARVIVPWSEIRAPADLDAAAQAVRGARGSSGRTALGQAMLVGAGLLGQQKECRSQILDLTGDGFSNDGPLPDRVAAQMFRGITVNALVIADEKGTGEDPSLLRLKAYFEEQVIRGPGAFVEPAQGFPNFQAAMERKLLRELGEDDVSSLGRAGLRLARAEPLP
jgi:hypothetical protein